MTLARKRLSGYYYGSKRYQIYDRVYDRVWSQVDPQIDGKRYLVWRLVELPLNDQIDDQVRDHILNNYKGRT